MDGTSCRSILRRACGGGGSLKKSGPSSLLRGPSVRKTLAPFFVLMAVSLSLGPPHRPISAQPPAGKAVVERVCSHCHTLERVDARRLDAKGWEAQVNKMTEFGAQLSQGERRDVAAR